MDDPVALYVYGQSREWVLGYVRALHDHVGEVRTIVWSETARDDGRVAAFLNPPKGGEVYDPEEIV